MKKEFTCPKCRSDKCETDEVQVISGSAWALKKGPHFNAITCSKCKYTEFYKK